MNSFMYNVLHIYVSTVIYKRIKPIKCFCMNSINLNDTQSLSRKQTSVFSQLTLTVDISTYFRLIFLNESVTDNF